MPQTVLKGFNQKWVEDWKQEEFLLWYKMIKRWWNRRVMRPPSDENAGWWDRRDEGADDENAGDENAGNQMH